MKAMWNGFIIAESPDTVIVEGNHYLALDSVTREYLVPSDSHSVCPWKGTANYYDLVVNGDRNHDAAWYYPEPKDAAQNIANRVAFWHGVTIVAD